MFDLSEESVDYAKHFYHACEDGQDFTVPDNQKEILIGKGLMVDTGNGRYETTDKLTDLINGYCDHCHDGEGNSIYPYYGLAPHSHIGESLIGSTIFTGELPNNFEPEDNDCKTHGVYTHCLECGAGF